MPRSSAAAAGTTARIKWREDRDSEMSDCGGYAGRSSKTRLKKCPRCNSISSDSDDSCGVFGGSLSGVASESLQQLVHKEPDVKPKRKLKLGGIALIIMAVTMTILGASLLVLLNALGVFLLLAGLLIMVYIIGGPGFGMGGRSGGKRSMQEAEARKEEEERKRRRGKED